MIGLDTSVVIRLLVGEPPDQARQARDTVAEAADSGDPALITDLVILEAYHALHHHYGVPKAEARELLASLLASGVVRPDAAELPATLRAAQSGAGVGDRLIHARHRAQGAITLTFDRRQARLPGASTP